MKKLIVFALTILSSIGICSNAFGMGRSKRTHSLLSQAKTWKENVHFPKLLSSSMVTIHISNFKKFPSMTHEQQKVRPVSQSRMDKMKESFTKIFHTPINDLYTQTEPFISPTAKTVLCCLNYVSLTQGISTLNDIRFIIGDKLQEAYKKLKNF